MTETFSLGQWGELLTSSLVSVVIGLQQHQLPHRRFPQTANAQPQQPSGRDTSFSRPSSQQVIYQGVLGDSLRMRTVLFWVGGGIVIVSLCPLALTGSGLLSPRSCA